MLIGEINSNSLARHGLWPPHSDNLISIAPITSMLGMSVPQGNLVISAGVSTMYVCHKVFRLSIAFLIFEVCPESRQNTFDIKLLISFATNER